MVGGCAARVSLPPMLPFLLASVFAAHADGMCLLSVEFPSVSNATLQAWHGTRSLPVLLTNDGSLALDQPDDDIWWALVPVTASGDAITVSGLAADIPVAARLAAEIAEGDDNFQLAFRAELEGTRWTFTPTEAPTLPEPAGRGRGTLIAVILGLLGVLGAVLVPVRRR